MLMMKVGAMMIKMVIMKMMMMQILMMKVGGDNDEDGDCVIWISFAAHRERQPWRHYTRLGSTAVHCSTLFQHCTEHKKCIIENCAFRFPNPLSLHWTAHSQPCALFLHPHIQNFRGLGSGVLCVQRHKYSAVCTLLTHMQNHSQHHTVALFNGKCNGCAKGVDCEGSTQSRWSKSLTPPHPLCTIHPSMHNLPTGWVNPQHYLLHWQKNFN